ncbi:hypothetical protein QFC19_004976 [Naganishia cerealis]|uniref:Uncharacterized protein n=1 Tax=Naganishia cerealis TaxID=610337 RepID=A0ACC2VSF6_9TREE|nr:hypothetical protein QFC19_004976 [Naganishia cerealis]
MRDTNLPNSINAHAGPSGTSQAPNQYSTLQNSAAADAPGNDTVDEDDLSSLPDEYKEEKEKDSDEDAVVTRSTWKGKERMIIHSDDDDDDDEDVYQEQQDEKLKRDSVRRKKGCTENSVIGNPMRLTSINTKNSLVLARTGRALPNEKVTGGDAGNIPGEIDIHELDGMDGSSSEDDDLEPSTVPLAHPGIIALPDTSNDVPLPEGIDPKNVEDVFLGLTAVSVPADWSEDDEDEGILFQALDDWHDSDDDMDAGSEASDDSGNGTSDTDMLDDNDPFDAAFGLGEPEMPLVLMEDWSGNLVFAQPRISAEGGANENNNRNGNSRSSTSVSTREKEKRRSRKGSGTGSTTNGEGPVLLVDEGALEEEWDENVFSDGAGDTYDGDTTDSLPDEDMPSPPNLMSFSGMAVSGVEVNNAAAFGVTTVDEAALARDLGVPLADARNLLERARAEEQQQLLGGVSNLSMTGNDEPTIMEPSPVDSLSAVDASVNGSLQALFMETNTGVSTSSAATTPNTNIEVSPHPTHAIPGLAITQSTPPSAAPGFPIMGAFLPEHEHPDRVAVIDGTGKVTPSPFMRRGGPRGRARGGSQTGTKGSHVKRQALGASPSTNGRRPRYSSVPAGRGHVSDSVRGSPLRLSQRESFDREDTSSDHEDLAEPIALDDVLDTSALHHHAHETDQDEEIYGSRHLRSLRRWEKVPITTFRRSRNSNAPFTSSTGLFAADGSSPSMNSQGFTHGPSNGAILRPTFASPSIASTLAMDPSTGYPVSPILEATTDQDGARNGKALHRTDKRAVRDSKKSKKQDQQQHLKTSRNGGLVRNRTASAGSMPPLRLS